MSPDQIHGHRLEFQHHKGGIPRLAPHKLAPVLPSLPPILYIQYRNPILSYSKAPWGLSVLPRVTGIFTGTTISPSVLLRQCPDDYTIRAGRNLPDKEFRYLRTVIVTAAVYRGFNSITTLLSLALEFSSCLPVSVCGTGALHIHQAFLVSFQTCFPTKLRSLTPGYTNTRVMSF